MSVIIHIHIYTHIAVVTLLSSIALQCHLVLRHSGVEFVGVGRERGRERSRPPTHPTAWGRGKRRTRNLMCMWHLQVHGKCGIGPPLVDRPPLPPRPQALPSEKRTEAETECINRERERAREREGVGGGGGEKECVCGHTCPRGTPLIHHPPLPPRPQVYMYV